MTTKIHSLAFWICNFWLPLISVLSTQSTCWLILSSYRINNFVSWSSILKTEMPDSWNWYGTLIILRYYVALAINPTIRLNRGSSRSQESWFICIPLWCLGGRNDPQMSKFILIRCRSLGWGCPSHGSLSMEAGIHRIHFMPTSWKSTSIDITERIKLYFARGRPKVYSTSNPNLPMAHVD